MRWMNPIRGRSNHGWVGPDHYLLALLAEPSPATEALAEPGVTDDRKGLSRSRARADAEEGVDLDALLAQARRPVG
jgi:hypothetical protein